MKQIRLWKRCLLLTLAAALLLLGAAPAFAAETEGTTPAETVVLYTTNDIHGVVANVAPRTAPAA